MIKARHAKKGMLEISKLINENSAITEVVISIGNPLFFIIKIIAIGTYDNERMMPKKFKLPVLSIMKKQNDKIAYAIMNIAPIGNLIFFVSFSIVTSKKQKSAPTEVSAPKNANSKLSPNELIRR